MSSRWRRAFVLAFVLQLAAKVLIAAYLPLFGDEAFYWLEGRHLAWGYSDLPGLAAWLTALGEALGGHHLLAVRMPFLALGALLPWLLVVLARRHFGARAGWQAGLLALALPLAGTLGVLALPDVPLTVAIVLAVLALDAALARNRVRDGLLLGLAVALALASHYRAGMLLLAGLVFATVMPRGRSLWRRPGWYAALAIGALGCLPALIYNLRHDWAGLAFQLVDRNPWQFQPRALGQPLVQGMLVTPVLYALLIWLLLRAWRRRGDAPWGLLAAVGLTFLGGYFLLGLFADNQRFHAHWPLPGYLPLLAALPTLASELWHRHRRLAWRGLLLGGGACLVAAQFTLGGWLAWVAFAGGADARGHTQRAAAVFAGWTSAGATLRSLGAEHADALPIVADNFRLAAELAFGIDRVDVYALDSPLNAKHGRAVQLRQWQLDETGLRAAHAGAPVWLAVEETALRARQRPQWLGGLCARFAAIQPVARIDIGPYKRIAIYRARVRAQPGPGGDRDRCIIWRQAYSAATGYRWPQPLPP